VACAKPGHVVDHATQRPRRPVSWRPAKPIDAIVLDRLMPQMDGLAMLAALRATGSRVPVLILSALSHVDERIRGLRAGGDDYLVKPFALSELQARLDVITPARPDAGSGKRAARGRSRTRPDDPCGAARRRRHRCSSRRSTACSNS
jgi:DNA-binding response OmpR family regulator